MPPVWVRRLLIAPAVVVLAIVLLTTLPLWLILVDPESDGAELERLAREWAARQKMSESNSTHRARRVGHNTRRRRASLPVFHLRD